MTAIQECQAEINRLRSVVRGYDFNHFDQPEEFWVLVNKAIELGVIQPKSLYELACKYGNNITLVSDEILEVAYADRNSCPSNHETLCPLYDNLHVVMKGRGI